MTGFRRSGHIYINLQHITHFLIIALRKHIYLMCETLAHCYNSSCVNLNSPCAALLPDHEHHLITHEVNMSAPMSRTTCSTPTARPEGKGTARVAKGSNTRHKSSSQSRTTCSMPTARPEGKGIARVAKGSNTRHKSSSQTKLIMSTKQEQMS